MATQAKLKAERREGRGKGTARKLRSEGKLPAVVYGAEVDPIAVTVSVTEAEKLFHRISVDNTIVNLEVEGERAPVPTLVREIQTHPFRPDLLHVDFYRIQKGVEVELDVPVHLTGTPVGVKDEGGVLEQPVHNIPVRCVPADIPESFEVDVSGLAVGDSLHIGELTVPKGVTILLDEERTVCSVQVPTELVIEEPEVEEELEVETVAEGEEEAAAEEAPEEDEGAEE